MKKKQKEDRPTLGERLCQCMDFPADMASGSLVEIRGRGNATVCGCKKILLYTPERIELEGKDFDTVIVGKKLEFTGFGDKSAELCGLIDKIEFRRRSEKCL